MSDTPLTQARSWIVRAPDGHKVYGPFNEAKAAIAFGQTTWPTVPERGDIDNPDATECWAVEQLFPPT